MTGDGGHRHWLLLGSVFLVSFVVLAFEVSLTRVFSVLLNYHHAFLAVSGGICGLGLGGFAWHVLICRSDRKAPEALWAALAFAFSVPGSILLLFGAANLLAHHLAASLITLVPFICAGAFLAEVFRSQATESGRIYHADLAGAGLAAVLVVPLIGLTGALHVVFLLGAAAAVAAAAWAAYHSRRFHFRISLAAALLLLLLWPISASRGLVRIRPLAGAPVDVGKLMVRDLGDPDLTPLVIDSEWTAYARTDLVRYDLPHQGAYTLQLFTDGETPAIMTPFEGDIEQVAFLREDVPYLAFDISPRDRLLSIGPGGGMDFLWGMLAGFKYLDGVEINDSVANLMERYRRINGDLYHYPGINVTIEDGRSFIRGSAQQYDLISSSLTQTATTGNIGTSLVESYIHTKEAFDDYYHHLTPHGRYALVTQSDSLLLRGALTALAVMEDHGIKAADGSQHLLAVSLPAPDEAPTPYRYLLVWKKSPLTPKDLAPSRRAIELGSVHPIFLPGSGGHPMLDGLVRGEYTLSELFAHAGADEGFPFDVRPATDNHPFFLDVSFSTPADLKGFLLLSLAGAVLFSLLLVATRLRASTPRPPVRGWLLYFSALGAGFMLIEIPLIQKLVLFLGHPTISLAAILCYLLTGASLGSLYSQRWPLSALPRRVAIASLLVALLVLAYLFLLSPALALFQGWPRHLRLLLLGVFVLPLGVVLGIPFPSGLRLMAADCQAEIPWMWGMNGMMSVVGSVTAIIVAKSIGFNGCLFLGALTYGLIAFILPRCRTLSPRAQTGARGLADRSRQRDLT